MKIEIILSGANGVVGATKQVENIDSVELAILFEKAWKQAEWDTQSAELWIDNIFVANQISIKKFGDFSITKYKDIYSLAFDEGDAQLQTTKIKNLRYVFA